MLCSVSCALPHLYRLWKKDRSGVIFHQEHKHCFPLRVEASTTAAGKERGAKAFLAASDSTGSALQAALFHSL